MEGKWLSMFDEDEVHVSKSSQWVTLRYEHLLIALDTSQTPAM